MCRCDRCSEVCDISEVDQHVCQDELARRMEAAKERQEVRTLLDNIANESASLADRVAGMKTYFGYLDIKKRTLVSFMNEKYPAHVVRPVVVEILNKRLDGYRQMLTKCYGQYDDQRKVGVPFVERRRTLNEKRIALCEQVIGEISKVMNNFKLRSWDELLEAGDKAVLAKRGVRGFLDLYLSIVIK